MADERICVILDFLLMSNDHLLVGEISAKLDKTIEKGPGRGIAIEWKLSTRSGVENTSMMIPSNF